MFVKSSRLNGMSGKLHTEEAKAKMSAAKIGEKHPQYGKTGESCPNFGRRHTDETRAKISATKKNNVCHNTGRKHTDETRAKISAANTGSSHNNAKLTESDVIEIRRLYELNDITLKALALQFSVSISTISNIINRKSWTHI
jgi:hypothetical protein